MLVGVVARNPVAVVGIAISGFCTYVMYKSLDSAAILETTLKSLSVLTLGEIVRRLKNGSGPVRAAVLGELEAEGKALSVHGNDAVAWQRQIFQHRATKRGSKKSLLSSKKGQCNVLLQDDTGSATVEGTYWAFPYQVANTTFEPQLTNVLSAITASLGGENILGLETVDSIVPVGLRVLGIGEFYLTHRGLAVRGLFGTNGIFTRESLSGVVNSASTNRLMLHIGFVAFSSVTAVCLLSIVVSELTLAVDDHNHEAILRRRAAANEENEDDVPVYNRSNTMAATLRQVVHMREEQREEQGGQQQEGEHNAAEEEQEQQQQHGLPASNGNGGGDDDDIEEHRCAVCLSNKRDTAIVPCGHVCMCSGCALLMCEQPRDVRRCPVCRMRIQDVMPLFYS